jgi:serine/threonine protein kinase
MNTDDNYRKQFKDISIYHKNLGSGFQSTVDLHVLKKNPEIQSANLGGKRDKNLGLVAIKNYKPDPKYGDLESGAINELNIFYRIMGCPHLIQLLDVEFLIINSKVILRVMLPYHTNTLENFIHQFSFDERLTRFKLIIDQLLNSLLQLKIKGIVHRDIKPANILIDYDFDNDPFTNTNKLVGDPSVYLADFGLAVQLPCDKKYRNIELNYRIGTPLYMAPELLTKHSYYDDKVDIWSLGVTLVEYLTEFAFTNPSLKSMKEAKNVARIALKYEILDFLEEDHSYNSLEKMVFSDHVNIHKIFAVSGMLEDYDKIPENILTLITSMLEIQPDDRLDIGTLFSTNTGFNINICLGSDKQLLLGTPKVDIKTYYDLLNKMLNVSLSLELNTRIFISALNLFNKYIHKYDINSLDKLILISATCLYITHKIMNNDESIDPGEYVFYYNDNFTNKDLQQAEIEVLQNSNYMVSSCYVDDFIHEVDEITEEYSDLLLANGIKNEHVRLQYAIIGNTYPLLQTMYKQIENDEKYVGALSNPELIKYIRNSKNVK